MSAAVHCNPSVSQRQLEKWLANSALLDIISPNTPAMPLSEAHFGGFFLPGVCR